MLKDTLGAYIDNMLKFLIFLGACLAVILLLFLFSNRQKNSSNKFPDWLDKGPYLYKNLMALATVFLTTIFSILFISNIVLVIGQIQLGPPLYILAGFLILLIFMAVYIVKSRIFNGGGK